MSTYEQKKQDTLRLFNDAISLAQQLQLQEYIQLLEKTAQRLEEGKFMIVVCGEFRRGKSSLLNAFLNEVRDLFPVDIAITTNLATTITYGTTEKITVLLDQPDSMDLKKISISRNEIRLYVTEKDNPHNIREARLMEIEVPNEQLKQGLTFVDTPGVGGLYTSHTDVTYGFISRADAIIYVSDAFQPLSGEDLLFIKYHILKHTDHIIFVLTKKDRVDGYEKIIESNREKLAATLGRPANAITIIPVSSSIKRRYLKTHEPEDLEDSNFSQLESALWQFVNAGRGRIVLARTLTTLGQTIGNMRRPLQVEFNTYQEQNKQKLDEIQSSLQESSTILQQLQDNNAQWQTQLQEGLEDIRNDVQYQFDRGFEEIRRNAKTYITDEVLKSPELVLGPVQHNINDLLHELERLISDRADKLQDDIEYVTGLSLNPFETQYLYERAKPLSVSDFTKGGVSETSTWKSALAVASEGNHESNILSLIGGLLLGSVGSIAGTVIGWLIGIQREARQSMQQARAQDLRRIEEQLMTVLADSQRDQDYTLANTIRELGRSMKSDLLDKIKRERGSREQALKSFQEARALTTTQANARLAILKGQLQQLDTLQNGIQALIQETIGQEDDPLIIYNDTKHGAESSKPEPHVREDTGD